MILNINLDYDWIRGGPLEKRWGGGKKAQGKPEQGKQKKKIRAPEMFEKKIRAETFQYGKL
jgi:hypothetical protein